MREREEKRKENNKKRQDERTEIIENIASVWNDDSLYITDQRRMRGAVQLAPTGENDETYLVFFVILSCLVSVSLCAIYPRYICCHIPMFCRLRMEQTDARASPLLDADRMMDLRKSQINLLSGTLDDSNFYINEVRH